MLARIGRLELLGEEVILVDAVVRECLAKADDAARAIGKLASERGTIAVLSATDYPASLGRGESAVLSWARTRQPEVACVFDDRAARSAARNLGVRFTGTLGLLLKAKVEGHLSLLRPTLELALRAGLYLDRRTVERALESVDEGNG